MNAADYIYKFIFIYVCVYICNNVIKKIRGYELQKKWEGHQMSWKEEVGAMWIQDSDINFQN